MVVKCDLVVYCVDRKDGWDKRKVSVVVEGGLDYTGQVKARSGGDGSISAGTGEPIFQMTCDLVCVRFASSRSARPEHGRRMDSSGASCLFLFGYHAAKGVVDCLGGSKMRPELGVDSNDFARAAVGVVTASRPTMKPRLADLGHLLERRVGRLIRFLHRVAVHVAWHRER